MESIVIQKENQEGEAKTSERVVNLTFEETALKVQAFALSWQKGHDRKPGAKIWKV